MLDDNSDWNLPFIFFQTLFTVRFTQNSLIIITLSTNYTLLVLSCMQGTEIPPCERQKPFLNLQVYNSTRSWVRSNKGRENSYKITKSQFFLSVLSTQVKNRHELNLFLFDVPGSELLIQECKLQPHVDPVNYITLMLLTPHQTQTFWYHGMQKKRSILNTLSSNSVKKEKEEKVLVRLWFLYLALKLFLKRAEIFPHLKMSYLMITSRNIKRNMRIIPSRLLEILHVICLSFFWGFRISAAMAETTPCLPLFIPQGCPQALHQLSQGASCLHFYSEHVLSALFIGWVIHYLLFYAFSSHFCFLI